MPSLRPHNAGSEFERMPLFSNITHSTPARSVQLSHNPSVHVYHALRLTVEQSNTPWLRAFLEQDGLGSLVEAVEQLSSTQFTGFSDAILLLDCIACVRSVLNTSLGMTHFLNSDIYMRKLVKGLSTGSTLSKKHVFELMTAVCVYSSLGHQKTVDALRHYQKSTDQASMFSVILAELKFSDTALYRTALMSLLNAVISCTEDIRTRCTLRNELIAMQLLDMMHHFRREEKDADLAIQLEAFSIAKHRDDLELAQNYKLNTNSHQDLFYAIYQEVLGTPEAGTFLSLLQDLHIMTSSNTKSGQLWKAIGQATHYLSSLGTKAEADHFMANLEEMTRPCRSTHNGGQQVFKDGVVVKGGPGICRLDRKDSGISVGSGISINGCYRDSGRSFHRQGSGWTSGSGSLRGSGRMTRIAEDEVRGQTNGAGARPTGSHKTLPWIKVPNVMVRKEVSVWGQGTENRLRPDYRGLDQEFPEAIRLQDADDEIELLTGAQSVGINVYLSRMDMSPEELVGYLEDGDDARVGLPGLRYLMAILPSHEEMQQLRGYKGERYDLGQAEQFLLLLTDLPDYRTLLTGLLFKVEFGPRYQKLKNAFSAMTKAARDILHHQGLKDFLFLLLDSGNYLNQGTVFGSAAGLRLSSLARVGDVHGQTPGTSLLDHLVRVADAQSEEVTLFAADIPQLSAAASHDLEELKTEVTALSTEMRRVLGLLATAHPSIKATFDFFIEDVKQDLQQLQDAICQLRSLSHQMALYFCEDEADFRLHTALKQVHHLCESVKKSTKDGIYGRQQTARAEKRQDEMKQSNIGVFNQQGGACSSMLVPQREKIVDCLLQEVHSGQVAGHAGDEVTTPDLEWDPLTVSHIPPASPLQDGEDSLGLSGLLEEDEAFRPCLPDRIEDVISHQYRKGHQVTSSSFLAPENGSRKKAHGPLASPEEFSLDGAKVWQQEAKSVSSRPAVTSSDPHPVPAVERVEATAHRRTASDPNESQHAVKKWIDYEKQQCKRKQTKMEVESKLTAASLGLEKNGQALSKEDILDLSDHVDKENAAPLTKEKKKKRSSFGLLKKISRALKPRNVEPQTKEELIVKKPPVRPTNLPLCVGKENVRAPPPAPGTQQVVALREHVVTSKQQVVTSRQQVLTSRQQEMTSRQPAVRSQRQGRSSLEGNRTALQEVQEEPLYRFVIYQKYQSDC